MALGAAIKDSNLSIPHLLYKYGRDVAVQSLLFKEELSESDMATAQSLDVPEFPIKGKDLLGMGIDAGPKVGEMLSSVEQWWISEDFKPNREECLSRATST